MKKLTKLRYKVYGDTVYRCVLDKGDRLLEIKPITRKIGILEKITRILDISNDYLISVQDGYGFVTFYPKTKEVKKRR